MFGFSLDMLMRGDLSLALGVLAIVAVLLFPIPTFLLDTGLGISITASVLILMTALFIERPLQLSTFPTILLISTMLRLSLNLATTKLILTHGHEGTASAGHVIEAFGNFVMSGNFVIGIIVFTILVIVNFVVITKGSGRIAEVAARFHLDAMPGRHDHVLVFMERGANTEGVGAVSLAGLLGLAVWQAGSLVVGAFFLGGLGLTSAVLYLAVVVLTWMLRRLKAVGSFGLRQAVNSLYRPGNQTRIILLAVGLGAFVVLAVQSLQTNLVREFDFTRNQRLPSLFFIDVQKSQIDELVRMVEEKVGEKAESTPTVRARIAFVNGQPFDFQQREVRQQQGQIGREFAVTYREKLDENESILDGDWWSENVPTEIPQVSVEEEMAGRLKVGVGDSITFDISGRKITVQVANVRKLDLRNTRTAFVFVFRPGVLETAPQTFAATVLTRVPPTERQRLQRDVLGKFPNVQIFDVADIVAAVQKLVANFVLAISFVGTFVILSGILILIGSIALTKSQRIYENAILKTLGARRLTMASILLTEYGLLGLLAGIIGSGFAVLLSWAVSRFSLGIDWVFDPVLAVAGILITALLVMLVGGIASFDVLFRKPLATLRSQ